MSERLMDDGQLDEAVRAVLADTPPMADRTFAAGRERVLAGAASRPGQGSAGRERAVADREARWERVLSGRTARRGRVPESRTAQPAPRGRGRWLALAAGVAVLAASGAVAVVVSTPSTASAAETLNKAASVVTSDPEVQPGDYLYTSTRDWALAVEQRGDRTFGYLYEGVVEVWRPQDWRGEWFQRYTITGKRQWVHGNEADARAAGVVIDEPGVTERAAACGDFVRQLGSGTCAPGSWLNPTPDFITTLPRDPDELRRQLVANATVGGPVALATDVLRTGWVPRDVRAALYQALAGLPDIRISDRAANLDGRVGVAFSAGDDVQRREMVIDPDDGRFIGERLVGAGEWEGLPAGTVWSFTSVTTAVADSRP